MHTGLADFQSLKPLLAGGTLSCTRLVETYLQQIDKGAHLNAFVTLFSEHLLEKAAAIDRKRSQGKAGRLAGMVLGIKDNLAWTEGTTTCGSRFLSGYVSPYAATVLQRLAAADALFIGKTNMDEFAMGSSSEHSAFGPVHHPLDLDRVPGGSSGGSAAAVAAGLCTAALGSDTGGSIRQPASFCGIAGLRPTWGRVSRYGLVAFASSLDQIGPLAHSVADCAEVLQVIAGQDPADATCAAVPVPDYMAALQRDLKGLRIGLPSEYFQGGLEAAVRDAVEECGRILSAAGAELMPVSLPHTEYAIAAYYIIADAEASANLARFDGARFGHRSAGATTLEEMYFRSRSEEFGEEVKRRIMLGTFVLSSGYYEAYYGKAQRVRTLLQRDFAEAFSKCDLLLTPVCPTTAFRLGEKAADPLSMYLSDVYTVSVNMAGLPALALACGRDAAGLPIGAQLIGPAFSEPLLLAAGHYLESRMVAASGGESRS
ncbi:MAG TPA: Asp-tRNA(Asn)/Glu-tRNA(Gln) amidotransferase subunit GatA [bacterium]|nr:Asp-tRNA(Asn)/Glu-tRNA(Gln) amidotransferase subunit GatA [bacterium]